MRSLPVLALVSAFWLPGCQTGGVPSVVDSETVLRAAEQRLAEGNLDQAKELLASRDLDEFPLTLRPRHAIALAKCELLLGDPWECFLALQTFADDYPHSELRGEAIDLQYESGRQLAASDAGFWFFWSDQTRARVVFEHINTRFPDSIHVADALRVLGEMAYRAEDYERAEQRFRELMRRRPESEWMPLARFRFAMSIALALRGPLYDLERMALATNELEAFLANPPENPQFVAEASDALDRLLRWQAERHVRIADFYRDIDNRFGEIQHLRIAMSTQFLGTEAAAEAERRLQDLSVTMPSAPGAGR
jgi:tetratricopeptide (TPR) repeat protein